MMSGMMRKANGYTVSELKSPMNMANTIAMTSIKTIIASILRFRDGFGRGLPSQISVTGVKVSAPKTLRRKRVCQMSGRKSIELIPRIADKTVFTDAEIKGAKITPIARNVNTDW